MTRAERNKIHQREWRRRNPDKSKESCRKYYAKNVEKECERKRIDFQKIKANGYSDKRRLYQRLNNRYRRIAKLCDDPLTEIKWLEVLEEHNHCCSNCKSTKDLTIDHIIPISKGGLHTKKNIGVLCRACNSSKGVKIL